jgi:hypothetical protein
MQTPYAVDATGDSRNSAMSRAGEDLGRRWRAFHHHATLCVVAYGFLVFEGRLSLFSLLQRFVDLQDDREIFLMQLCRLGLELMLQLAPLRFVEMSGRR